MIALTLESRAAGVPFEVALEPGEALVLNEAVTLQERIPGACQRVGVQEIGASA